MEHHGDGATHTLSQEIMSKRSRINSGQNIGMYQHISLKSLRTPVRCSATTF